MTIVSTGICTAVDPANRLQCIRHTCSNHAIESENNCQKEWHKICRISVPGWIGPKHIQWNTLNKGHLSNEDTVCSPNHIELCTNLPLN